MNQVCPICGSEKNIVFHNKTRDLPYLESKRCCNCNVLFLANFDHIVDSHYQNSQMHADHSITPEKWMQEGFSDDNRRFLMFKKLFENKNILDVGCGAGGFLKLIQSFCSNAFGVELEKKLKNFHTKNKLKVFQEMEHLPYLKFDYISIFHVLEHIKNPIEFLKNLRQKLSNNGEIIIEVPHSEDALISLYNLQEFKDFAFWSNHLFVFNESSLSFIAERVGMRINWIKYIQRYPLSNHLHWISKRQPGGHKLNISEKHPGVTLSYEKFLIENKLTDTLILSLKNDES